MNDRLMIAAMAAQSDLSRSDANDRLFASIAADAFRMADALLAAAGEQEKPMMRLCAGCEMRDVDIAHLRARAEAAESKCASLEAENAKLRRQAEPLTEEECIDVMEVHHFGALASKQQIQAVITAADRIRARRSSNG